MILIENDSIAVMDQKIVEAKEARESVKNTAIYKQLVAAGFTYTD